MASGGGDGGVRFENAAYSWAKNIEVTECNHHFIGLNGDIVLDENFGGAVP
jgi:hypothetical protein